MNINSKYKKQIITALVGAVLAVGLTGCSNDKNELSDKEVAQEVKGESNNKQKISVEEASTILYDKLNGTDLWWEHRGENDDYYIFEETTVGADFRYLVNVYTGELFYELADAIGEIIPYEGDNDVLQVGPKDIKLVNDIKPKLKNREGIEQVKSEISSKVQGIIKKYGYEISDATETNELVIVDSEYEKYTEKYKQLMYYLMNEDYSNGVAHLNFNFEQEIHADAKITEDDNYVKLLHEMYVYLTGSDIDIVDFTSHIQNLLESNIAPTELTDKYLGVSFENEAMGGSRRKLIMRYYSPIDGLMKSKYYRKKYDTVAEYKRISEEKSKEIKQFREKTHYTLTQEEIDKIMEREPDYINKDSIREVYSNQDRYLLSAKFNYGKNTFMQTGEIILEPRSIDCMASQSEIDLLHNALKIVLEEELYNKLDKSNLTIDYINKVIRSVQTKNKYETILPTNDLGNEITWSIPMEMSNAKVKATDSSIIIEFSIPVEAEGIRGV